MRESPNHLRELLIGINRKMLKNLVPFGSPR